MCAVAILAFCGCAGKADDTCGLKSGFAALASAYKEENKRFKLPIVEEKSESAGRVSIGA